MLFRYARHTNDLQKIERFYTQTVGLEKLGGFLNHDTYDGIFLGLPSQSWHLEFTASNEKSSSTFDEDDALVFDVNSRLELSEIRNRILKNAVEIETPKNPYWRKNGLMISDPDGFKIIFSIEQVALSSEDPLTNLVREKSIDTWSDLLDFTQKLAYGRNQNREDFSLVVRESKGTCSSKHAFLKKLADLNGLENVKLVLGIYKMDHTNTPKIQSTLTNSGLDYLPEAHCYLKINNIRLDVTSENSNMDNLAGALLEELEIEPEQANTFKVDYHKTYIKNWMAENSITMSFKEVWEIRERCIKKLEG